MIHSRGAICDGCLKKLETTDQYLRLWFIKLKISFPNVHICWAWRGEKDQRADFESRRSEKQWPTSKHNFMLDGKPNSLALDLFQINDRNEAMFNPDFYLHIYNWSLDNGWKINWGGNYRVLKDCDHFEMVAIPGQ